MTTLILRLTQIMGIREAIAVASAHQQWAFLYATLTDE